MIRRLAWLASCLALTALPASAHPVPFSYLDLHLQPDRIEATLVVHVIDVAHDLRIETAESFLDPAFTASMRDRFASLIEPRLTLLADGRAITPVWEALEAIPDRQAVRARFHYTTGGPVGQLQIKCTLFPYDPNHQTFLNVYEGERLTLQGIFDLTRTGQDYYAGTRQGTLAVVARFVPSGIHHILIGPDHILFLIGLLLLGGTLRRLLFIVTAFTIAHSLTLSLAALNLVTPPAQLIEPAIALSIIYVGADNLLVRDGRDVRPWIAFAFGLIHGFGFANVLREMDLPARALGWSLFSFNVGVEIGQVCVVAIVAALLAWVRNHNARLGQRVTVAGSIVVMGAGAFWFVERVFFTGGA